MSLKAAVIATMSVLSRTCSRSQASRAAIWSSMRRLEHAFALFDQHISS